MKLIRRLERYMPPWLWDNLATISILGFCALMSWFGYSLIQVSNKADRNAHQAQQFARQAKQLAVQNRQIIGAQQKSRVASCRLTYESFREVLGQFIPPTKAQTPEQMENLRKFNRKIDAKKAACVTQTKSKKQP